VRDKARVMWQLNRFNLVVICHEGHEDQNKACYHECIWSFSNGMQLWPLLISANQVGGSCLLARAERLWK